MGPVLGRKKFELLEPAQTGPVRPSTIGATTAELARQSEKSRSPSVTGVGVLELEVAGDVAFAVRRVGPDDHREVGVLAVPDAAGRRRDAGLALQALHEAVVLVVLVAADGAVELHAFEVGLHDEVDDAGDGVRAVGRRGAAGGDFDVVDQRHRDLVEVGGGVRVAGVRVADAEAPAVDQHQGALRAEAAKVGGGDAARRGQRVGGVREVGRGDLEVRRQGVQRSMTSVWPRKLELLVADSLDRADAGQVRLRDARAGDDDLAGGRGVGRGVGAGVAVSGSMGGEVGGGGLGGPGRGAEDKQRGAGDHGRRQQAPTHSGRFQSGIPPERERPLRGAARHELQVVPG